MQDACQRLMIHPYITDSRTIVNILTTLSLNLALDTKQSVASLGKWDLLGIMSSPYYPASAVLFQHHGGMFIHMQVLATPTLTVHNTKYLDPYR